MKVPYTQCGKRGNTIWQKNRYCQISYPYHRPYDPKTEAQTCVRGNFGRVSKRWQTLTEDMRLAWGRQAKHQKSRRRLGQCWPLKGFYYFMKVNVALANRGLEQMDWPPVESLEPKLALPLLSATLSHKPTRFGTSLLQAVSESAGRSPPPTG